MDHTFLSAFILFLLALDPFGVLPIFTAIMGGVAPGALHQEDGSNPGVDAVTTSVARLGHLLQSAPHEVVTSSQEMQAISHAMLV